MTAVRWERDARVLTFFLSLQTVPDSLPSLPHPPPSLSLSLSGHWMFRGTRYQQKWDRVGQESTVCLASLLQQIYTLEFNSEEELILWFLLIFGSFGSLFVLLKPENSLNCICTVSTFSSSHLFRTKHPCNFSATVCSSPVGTLFSFRL